MGVFSDRHSQFPFNLFVVIWLLIQQHVKQTNKQKAKEQHVRSVLFLGFRFRETYARGCMPTYILHAYYKTATREEKAHINNLVEPGNFDPIINE